MEIDKGRLTRSLRIPIRHRNGSRLLQSPYIFYVLVSDQRIDQRQFGRARVTENESGSLRSKDIQQDFAPSALRSSLVRPAPSFDVGFHRMKGMLISRIPWSSSSYLPRDHPIFKPRYFSSCSRISVSRLHIGILSAA